MPDYATIYIADPSLLGSKVFDKLNGVVRYKDLSSDGQATGIKFALDAGDVVINFMPNDRVESHLEAFSDYVRQGISDEDLLIYVLPRIHYVRMVLGCVIRPRCDDASVIENFLFELTRCCNGLLFAYGTVYDYDGEPLFGKEETS